MKKSLILPGQFAPLQPGHFGASKGGQFRSLDLVNLNR